MYTWYLGTRLPRYTPYILTAISEDACAGDSGRGAVAEALVEALACDAAAGCDFSVATAAGRAAPSREDWASMFADAS